MCQSQLPLSQFYLGFSNNQGVQIDRHSKTINYFIVGQLSTRYLLPSFRHSRFSFPSSPLPLPVPNLSKFFHVHQELSYLDWRYVRNPKCQYRYYTVMDNSRPIGTIICRENFFRCDISQVNLSTHNPQTWSSVITDFSRFCFTRGKFIVSITFLRNLFWNDIFPNKFSEKPAPVFFTIKSYNKSHLDKNNWLIQGGDIQ
jgi:hypothetical protein